MRWHPSVHGSSIRVSSDGLSASRRSGAPPYHGLLVSRDVLPRGAWVSLSVSHVPEWIGCLRLGVTSYPPDILASLDNQEDETPTLPKFACPNWCNREGIWLRPVTDLTFAQQHALAQGNAGSNHQLRLSLNVNSAGQLHYYVNGVHKGHLHKDLPVNDSIWLLLELCGDTHAIRIVPDNDAPSEITGRGGTSLTAYHRACETGTKPVHRTRLMVVGEDGTGKTSLIKVLTGQKWCKKEEATPAIDISASCSFRHSAPAGTTWRLTTNGKTTEGRYSWAPASSLPERTIEEEEECEDLFQRFINQLGGDTEEERMECQAQNKALEILYSQQQPQNRSLKPSQKSPRLGKNQGGRVSRSNSVQPAPTSDIKASEDATSLEDLDGVLAMRVSQLIGAVQEKRQMVSKGPGKNKEKEEELDVTLNIWDFGGQLINYSTHQLFLSSRAVYVMVFNLENDLDSAASHPLVGNYQDSSAFSHIDYLDYWFNLIHAHTAEPAKTSSRAGEESAMSPELESSEMLTPPIFVVGTHARSLGTSDEDIQKRAEACFERIRDYIRYKVYSRHVIPEFYLVDSSDDASENQLSSLREHIQRVVYSQSYMGEMIPIKWLRLERRIEALKEQGTRLLWINQMISLAQEEGIYSEEDALPALEFLHDLGVVIFFGKSQMPLNDLVIVDPQWLVELFRAVLSAKPVDLNASTNTGEAWYKLRHSAVLDERLLDTYWASHRHAKMGLIGLMEKFDLAAERLPNPINSTVPLERSFYVPSLLKPWTTADPNFYDSPNSVIFFLKFQYFLPDGLFQRLLTRSILWSQEQGGRDPVLFYNKAWFFVDQEHDFSLEMHSYRLSRVKVSVYRVSVPAGGTNPRETCPEGKKEEEADLPSPHVVAKVRRFIETVLEELRRLWMRRMAYQVVVACPCGAECREHSTPRCLQPECIHFLNIDECLSNKIVCCGHRRVKTEQWKAWFPTSLYKDGYAPPILPNHVLSSDVWNIEVQKGQFIPHWMKAAAKLLNGAVEGEDWKALCEQLGYNEAQISRFNDDLNPALLLIADWVVTNGNTNLAVDMLVACLYQMGRGDIGEAIEEEREAELDRAQIFLCYQWDSQEVARGLRDHLERAGFPCWMDIGQMGGGDVLLARVERALRQCRVVVAAVTPRLVLSAACTRELCLADLLRKPLVPVLVDRTPWPPPGPMALILSQYVYVDLCGVGGHGGSGAKADRAARLDELLQQVSKHATPERVEIPEPAPPSTEPQSPAVESYQAAEEGVAQDDEEEGAVGDTGEIQGEVETAGPPEREEIPLHVANVRRCTVCHLL